MILKKSLLYILFISSMMTVRSISYSQCNHQEISASNYLIGSCNEFYFQGLVGSLNSSYGSCGGLHFGAPLTGGGITTNTKNIYTDIGVEVFPNPTYGHLEINLPISKLYNIRLYNPIGQLLKSEVVKNNRKHFLNIENLKTGYYILKISIENDRTQIFKIIKL